MATMERALWLILALMEMIAVAVLSLPFIIFAIKLARTKPDILWPNIAYFLGMGAPYVLLLVPSGLLAWHLAVISRKFARKRISN
jgi:hypothetical protein